MKARRQGLILELIDREPLHSQEEVRHRLHQQGVKATQATISRDIKDLGLVKRAVDGAYQRLEGQRGRTGTPRTTTSALERAASEFLHSVECVQQLVVLRTGAGQAQPLALAIDRAELPEAVGTVAGDDTILLIARDGRRAASLAKRLRELAAVGAQL